MTKEKKKFWKDGWFYFVILIVIFIILSLIANFAFTGFTGPAQTSATKNETIKLPFKITFLNVIFSFLSFFTT